MSCLYKFILFHLTSAIHFGSSSLDNHLLLNVALKFSRSQCLRSTKSIWIARLNSKMWWSKICYQ